MQVDGAEGHVIGHLQPLHDHAGYPEEEDIIAGFHHVGWIEAFQIWRLIRPAQGGEGPQPGAEPGVEHVGVLFQARAATLLAGGWVLPGDGQVIAVGAVPDRDTMPPPQLAADAPIPNVLQPVIVDLGEPFRDDGDAPIPYDLQPSLGQRLHPHEPLGADHWLDHLTTSLGARHLYGVLLGLDGQAGRFHIGPQLAAAPVAIQPGVGTGVLAHGDVRFEDADDGQTVALADLEVVGIVAWRDLQRAGAEFHRHIGVANHGDGAVEDRHQARLADQMPVTIIVGVDGHCCVAQDGLGAGGGYRDIPLSRSIRQIGAGQRVLEVIQGAFLFPILHLQVADSRL